MMEMPPKLPKPSAWIYGELAPGKALTFARPQMARTAGPDGVTPIYTAADLRAYGESCARMAREEAAKPREVGVTLAQVEELAKSMWKDDPVPGRVLRFGAAVLGLADAAMTGEHQ